MKPTNKIPASWRSRCTRCRGRGCYTTDQLERVRCTCKAGQASQSLKT